MIKKIFFCAFLVFGQSFLLFSQVKIVIKTGKIAPFKKASGYLFLAGDFNGWNPADTTWKMQPGINGSYSLVKNLEKGIYNYKITRGSWDAVECDTLGKAM